jgi:hypothetical protein
LVLDGSDCSLGGPVDFVGEVGGGGLGASAFGGDLFGEADEVLGFELGGVEVSELVHFEVVGFKTGLVTFVVGLNVGEVLQPDADSVGLFLGGVVLAELEFPGVEGVVFDGGISVVEGVKGDRGDGENGQ